MDQVEYLEPGISNSLALEADAISGDDLNEYCDNIETGVYLESNNRPGDHELYFETYSDSSSESWYKYNMTQSRYCYF